MDAREVAEVIAKAIAVHEVVAHPDEVRVRINDKHEGPVTIDARIEHVLYRITVEATEEDGSA